MPTWTKRRSGKWKKSTYVAIINSPFGSELLFVSSEEVDDLDSLRGRTLVITFGRAGFAPGGGGFVLEH